MVLVVLVGLVVASCGSDAAPVDDVASTTTSTVPRSEAGDLSDPPPGVVGKEWRAVLIIDGNDDVLPPVDASVTVQLDDDSVSGSAGCNTFDGEAEFKASQLTIANLAITAMACADVEDWMPMLDVLSDAVRVELVGPNLIVWAADDRGLLLE